MERIEVEYSLAAGDGAAHLARAWAHVPAVPTPAERADQVARAARLLTVHDAALVAHYYVDGTVQDLALATGGCVADSLEMARFGRDHPARTLVVAGVRFMGEIAGTTELGGMGRGEHIEIGTYIGKSIESELSGNVIDVCPVGALTNKVHRFRARAWELVARESIGYHDAIGSKLYLHVRRGEAMRAVPRDDEAINECWISDRDRYSHQSLESADRATRPMVRRDGKLVAVSWDEAIAFVAAGLKRHGADLGALVEPLQVEVDFVGRLNLFQQPAQGSGFSGAAHTGNHDGALVGEGLFQGREDGPGEGVHEFILQKRYIFVKNEFLFSVFAL